MTVIAGPSGGGKSTAYLSVDFRENGRAESCLFPLLFLLFLLVLIGVGRWIVDLSGLWIEFRKRRAKALPSGIRFCSAGTLGYELFFKRSIAQIVQLAGLIQLPSFFPDVVILAQMDISP